jgi:histidyl-tRNA synthetase
MIKLPKGTQDYFRESYDKLEYIKNIITQLFTKFHGEFVESPVFELTHVLMNKYGEEEKLIFNIESENNDTIIDDKYDNTFNNEIIESQKEKISLRYDHTIPLVRFCIINKMEKIRRCCIGKVYRKETVTRSQVRLREFYQADFDYVGIFDSLIPELEIFCMIQELFKTLRIENYQILYNYRQNLDFYTQQANIDHTNFASVCSSIDKLDKKDKQYIRLELLNKGLSEFQIDKLFEYLFSTEPIMADSVIDLNKNFHMYMDLIKTIDKSKIIFTPTLARGSDYYTGIIFEVKLTNTDFISSVAGGGRYDKLISSYTKSDENVNKNMKKNMKSTKDVPMIGFSFGIDRLLPFIQLPQKVNIIPKIWISVIGKIENPIKTKLDIIGKLQIKGYSVFYNLSNRKFKKEISDANENDCNFIIIIGENEWIENKVAIKNMNMRTQTTIMFDEIDNYFSDLTNNLCQ